MIRFAKPYPLFAVLSITCWAQIAQVSIKQPVPRTPTKEKAAQSTRHASTTNNGILYWARPVLNQPTVVNVHYIWYGDWFTNPSSNQILTDFARRSGGSPYFNINTTYYDNDKGASGIRCSIE